MLKSSAKAQTLNVRRVRTANTNGNCLVLILQLGVNVFTVKKICIQNEKIQTNRTALRHGAGHHCVQVVDQHWQRCLYCEPRRTG